MVSTLAPLWLLVRRWLSRFFSPRIEDSWRLRLIGLSSLWLAAWGLTWVGGSYWLSLAGGGLGTVGHLLSWYWRRRPPGIRPLLIGLAMIALSILMRSELLEVFSGDWLPLGHFLVLVLALASFDMRTRGGLYTALGLSGVVLFFASQQAFDPSFVIFVVGFVVLILAFLSLTFLEDGIRDAQVHWVHQRPMALLYWIGTTCAVFVLSGLAFWLMPRGEDDFIRPPRVAILPYTGATATAETAPNLTIVPIGPTAGDVTPSGEEPFETQQAPLAGVDEFLKNMEISKGNASPTNQVVLFVRSKVASYWRGQTLENFDGQYWRSDSNPEFVIRSAGGPTVLYNRESRGLDNRIWYHQTYYVQVDHPESVFMGYRGLRIVANEGDLRGLGVKRGDSYRVLSAHPQYSPEKLRLDVSSGSRPRLTDVPRGTGRLRSLARRITAGASSDFEKAERIVSYLAQRTNFDDYRPGDLKSSATMNEFLFQGEAGSALDYASATVMLARAAGLPSRMAVGYLPGVRDPLSGAYLVRESDAHAWAEIYFAGHGWVPFDGAPRTDLILPGHLDSRLARLFQSGVGEKIYGSAKAAPGQLAGPTLDFLRNPVISILGPVLILAAMVLRWLFTRRQGTGEAGARAGLAYTRLSGGRRRELLNLYSQVEKLLRRRIGVRRVPWQTVASYTSGYTNWTPEVQSHLSWFTRAVWHAAYNPGELPAGAVEEARSRLVRLRAERRW